MKRIIIVVLYAISSFLDDVAFYVVGDEQEDIGIEIETPWCKHCF